MNPLLISHFPYCWGINVRFFVTGLCVVRAFNLCCALLVSVRLLFCIFFQLSLFVHTSPVCNGFAHTRPRCLSSILLILPIPFRFLAVKDFWSISPFNLFVPDEGYSISTSHALNLLYIFVLHFCHSCPSVSHVLVSIYPVFVLC
jgi:hypothetical protein